MKLRKKLFVYILLLRNNMIDWSREWWKLFTWFCMDFPKSQLTQSLTCLFTFTVPSARKIESVKSIAWFDPTVSYIYFYFLVIESSFQNGSVFKNAWLKKFLHHIYPSKILCLKWLDGQESAVVLFWKKIDRQSLMTHFAQSFKPFIKTFKRGEIRWS